MSERNYLLLLGDVQEAIKRIEEYTKGMDYHLFDSSNLIQDAVYRNFEVIGEAAGKFSATFQQAHPQIDWRLLKNFGNVLIHRYFEIDTQIVWNALTNELKSIKQAIEQIIQNES